MSTTMPIPTQQLTRPPVKRAFLIGVSDYGPSGTSLPFCKRDVEMLAAVLKHKGYECIEWVDRPLRDVLDKQALWNHISAAKNESDDVLFYFSGHGLDIGGEQVLQGKNARMNDPQKALTQDDVLLLSHVMDCLSKLPARKILIVDACRVVSENSNLNAALQKQRRSALQATENCAVVFASVDGTESFGTPTNNGSRFTMALVEELKQYGRGILRIVEEVTERVSQVNDGKRQTPWLYASLRDRPMDAFGVNRVPNRHQRQPKYLARSPGGHVWAVLAGSNALAEMKNGIFVNVVRLPRFLHSGIRCYEPSNDGLRHLFVKSTNCSLDVLTIAKAAQWEAATSTRKRLGATTLTKVFGASWSPQNGRVIAYGTPERGKLSVKIWRFEANGTAVSEKIDGMPNAIEANSVCWIREDELLISCSSGSDMKAKVFALTKKQDESWRCQLQWTSSHPLRISAMLDVGDRGVALGGDDGSIAVAYLNKDEQPEFTPREHEFSGRSHLPLLPWTGSSRSGIHNDELGVVSLAVDSETGLLGCAYFDSTIAFYDRNLKTYVKKFTLHRGGHLPCIRTLASRTFMSVAGTDVAEFQIESI